MFSYISGQIVENNGAIVVVDVGGIGYELAVSAYTSADCQVGQTKKLFAYLQVREDGVSLFGFSTVAEKNMFLNLISVSGVGCKMAQSVLSGMDSASLASAIFREDTKALVRIKGLGKKTAERIVLELKEKVFADDGMPLPIVQTPETKLTKDMHNAVAILCSLGKSQSEAERLVEAASKLGATTAEELVNMSFRIN